MRRVLRSTAISLATVSALLAAGCGSDSPATAIYSPAGWPAMHADAGNSNSSPVTGSRSVSFDWSRPLGAPTATPASVASTGQIFATTGSDRGCNLWSFEMDSGRKRWCTRIGPGVAASTPIVDTATNVYIGEDGAMSSFTEMGQLRWRTVVSGTPISAQFTGDGNVLFVTQFGVVSVLSPQTGKEIVPSYQLVPAPTIEQGQNIPLPPAAQGLDTCALGSSPECPVANTPAIDLETGRFYLTVWRPGRPAAELVAMRYRDGQLTEEWSSGVVPGGSASSPVLSADRATVYVTDTRGVLFALDAGTGAARWQQDLGYVAAGSPSVSADGLIIPAGGPDGHLLALRDLGDRGEIAWERKELRHLGDPAQTAGGTGYTTVRDGADGLALITFDTGTGETVDRDALPNASGYPVGTSIGPDGEVLTSSAIGELFVFTP
ncbi:PQQ-binding-like beta-propeller repeat protein [Rhodococcus sp. NPDC058505]|uniref:outer membrane protein assembly factor BamB family protein n=1 Tax=unclassified Rhodococcus (in: high G+C Gram-positive bacteria) TaxID=192944 RepID=UPI0036617FA1